MAAVGRKSEVRKYFHKKDENCVCRAKVQATIVANNSQKRGKDMRTVGQNKMLICYMPTRLTALITEY